MSLDKGPLNTGDQVNSFTPIRQEVSKSEDLSFISPIHELNTSVTSHHSNSYLNSITPLKEPDADADLTPIALTPSSNLDVDFTPIKTPWRQSESANKRYMNTSSIRSKASENIEGKQETVRDAKGTLQFTPLQELNKGTPSERRSKLELFLQNNRKIFTPKDAAEWGHSVEKENSFHNLAVTNSPRNSQDMINFLTPFKDPFSPSSRGHDDADTTTTPVNLNISAQEVDDFIEEVISNTSKTPAGKHHRAQCLLPFAFPYFD